MVRRSTGAAEAQDGVLTPPVAETRGSVVLSSNDYLGLSQHPAVVEAAHDALRAHGVGSGSTRGAARSAAIFDLLEQRLADFKGTSAALVFQSGYAANVGLVPALVGHGDLFVRDERTHASAADGALLSGASVRTYRHADPGDLELMLDRWRRRHASGSIAVATDGVFGMSGDIAPLPDICTVAERFDAMVIVDDAHATGVLGNGGRGSVDHHGVRDRVAVQVGTLSKALGGAGGFVAAGAELRQRLATTSHPTLYSTMPPVAIAAACIAALDVLVAEPGRLARLWQNVAVFKAALVRAGWSGPDGGTPIVPVFLATAETTGRFSSLLREQGIISQAIASPSGVDRRPRLRLIVRSEIAASDLERAAAAVGSIARGLDVAIA